jgi:hypothetical protein
MVSAQQNVDEAFVPNSGSQSLAELAGPAESSAIVAAVLAENSEAPVVTLPSGEVSAQLAELLEQSDLPLLAEIKTLLNQENFALLYDQLVPRLAAKAAEKLDALEFGINMGLIELLENSKDYHEPKNGNAEVAVSWNFEGASPFISVANSGSSIFDPARYLNRSGEDVYEAAQDLNCHMGIQMAVNFGEKLAYRWNSEDAAPITMTLRVNKETDLVVCEPNASHPDIQPRLGARSKWLEVTMHLATASTVSV